MKNYKALHDRRTTTRVKIKTLMNDIKTIKSNIKQLDADDENYPYELYILADNLYDLSEVVDAFSIFKDYENRFLYYDGYGPDATKTSINAYINTRYYYINIEIDDITKSNLCSKNIKYHGSQDALLQLSDKCGCNKFINGK